jgi:hypothetical protein
MRREDAWPHWLRDSLVAIQWHPSSTITHMEWTVWKVAIVRSLTVTFSRRMMLIIPSAECGRLLASGEHNWRVRNPINVSLMSGWLPRNVMIGRNLLVLAPRGRILS